MSQAISISSTRLINFNYDFANCCVTIATMTIKQDLRTYTNKFLNCLSMHITILFCHRRNKTVQNRDQPCPALCIRSSTVVLMIKLNTDPLNLTHDGIMTLSNYI